MKRALILIVVGLLLVGGCRNKNSAGTTANKASAEDLRQDCISVPATQAMSNSGEKVVYTCPMHPEIVSDQPGKCPKCGMTLVPQK